MSLPPIGEYDGPVRWWRSRVGSSPAAGNMRPRPRLHKKPTGRRSPVPSAPVVRAPDLARKVAINSGRKAVKDRPKMPEWKGWPRSSAAFSKHPSSRSFPRCPCLVRSTLNCGYHGIAPRMAELCQNLTLQCRDRCPRVGHVQSSPSVAPVLMQEQRINFLFATLGRHFVEREHTVERARQSGSRSAFGRFSGSQYPCASFPRSNIALAPGNCVPSRPEPHNGSRVPYGGCLWN